jgi:class I fructose-bisphosphate aldolase
MANTTINVKEVLGADAEGLLAYAKAAVSKDRLHLPGPDFVDRVVASSDRNQAVLNNWQRILNTGRLGGTGYVSILPVDQGIEHSAGASFAPNPDYFDADKIIELAVEGGCNAVASTYGVLGMTARKWAHKIPYLVKFNHNELMTYPNTFNQIPFGTIRQCWNMGAAAVGATIYFGSEESGEQIQYVADMFAEAHELGMVTVLWCYLRNPKFKVNGVDYHTAADLTAQANHLGATIQADIVKQKLPEVNGGFKALNSGDSSYGKFSTKIYTEIAGCDENGGGGHPIDLCRYQLVNQYMGRVPLINSGGASSGAGDLKEAVTTAVVNKRAGGMGLISGRKAFKRPMNEGAALLHAIQDVYLDESVTVA